jgi:alcohol dehydrogenase (NADP+)
VYNDTKAYSAASAAPPLVQTTISRCDPTEHDVQLEILFCGICHSDLHQVRNEFHSLMRFPVVAVKPGVQDVSAPRKIF